MFEQSLISIFGMSASKEPSPSGILAAGSNSPQTSHGADNFITYLVNSMENTSTVDIHPSTSASPRPYNISDFENAHLLTRLTAMYLPTNVETHSHGKQIQLNHKSNENILGLIVSNNAPNNVVNKEATPEQNRKSVFSDIDTTNNTDLDVLDKSKIKPTENTQEISRESYQEQPATIVKQETGTNLNAINPVIANHTLPQATEKPVHGHDRQVHESRNKTIMNPHILLNHHESAHRNIQEPLIPVTGNKADPVNTQMNTSPPQASGQAENNPYPKTLNNLKPSDTMSPGKEYEKNTTGVDTVVKQAKIPTDNSVLNKQGSNILNKPDIKHTMEVEKPNSTQNTIHTTGNPASASNSATGKATPGHNLPAPVSNSDNSTVSNSLRILDAQASDKQFVTNNNNGINALRISSDNPVLNKQGSDILNKQISTSDLRHNHYEGAHRNIQDSSIPMTGSKAAPVNTQMNTSSPQASRQAENNPHPKTLNNLKPSDTMSPAKEYEKNNTGADTLVKQAKIPTDNSVLNKQGSNILNKPDIKHTMEVEKPNSTQNTIHTTGNPAYASNSAAGKTTPEHNLPAPVNKGDNSTASNSLRILDAQASDKQFVTNNYNETNALRISSDNPVLNKQGSDILNPDLRHNHYEDAHRNIQDSSIPMTGSKVAPVNTQMNTSPPQASRQAENNPYPKTLDNLKPSDTMSPGKESGKNNTGADTLVKQAKIPTDNSVLNKQGSDILNKPESEPAYITQKAPRESYQEQPAKYIISNEIPEQLKEQIPVNTSLVNSGTNSPLQKIAGKTDINESSFISDTNTNSPEVRNLKPSDSATFFNSNGEVSDITTLQAHTSSDDNFFNNQGRDNVNELYTNSVNTKQTIEQETNFTNTLSQLKGAAAPFESLGNDIADNIIQKAKLYMEGGRSEIRILLNPEELGALKLEFTTEDGNLDAKITVERSSVKDVIEKDLPKLRELISNADIDVGKFDVFLQEKGNDRFGFLDKGFQSGSGNNNAKNSPDQQEQVDSDITKESMVYDTNSNQINYLV